jgi:alkyl sulfatase BDS1-like metallo-beta-lactamase superfamily hydrolase
VHPSLWRQAQTNHRHGLYKVVDGVYQLRGYDLSVMTLVEGERGWIVVDPLTAEETAARALDFARRTLGPKPVSAVVFTHSHVDHFGGARAVASPEDVASGRVRVIAPRGFLEEATSENGLAGPAMGRRATFMYGRNLPRSPRGRVDNGIGKEPALGAIGILRPTELVDQTGQALTIDGVPFVFQSVPGTEAPTELNLYLPGKRLFLAAEVAGRTLHNLYTLRGAKVRDAVRWAAALDEALERFPDAEVMAFSHHWPVWGRERIRTLLTEQRDLYRYVHDQTLHLANQGLGPREIAETIRPPASLMKHWWSRGYYGTVKHDAKAVYQLYFGWYDGNPANLDPLPRREQARRYVAAMGGEERVLSTAQAAFDEGDYRWVAELLNHAVAAAPRNGEARSLLARAYDQLGYQAESTAWRNAYLTAADELRHGPPTEGVRLADATGLLAETSPEQVLETFAVALDGPRAEGVSLTINFDFREPGEQHVVTIENAVLHHRKGPPAPGADATLSITRGMLVKLVTSGASIADLVASTELDVSGSRLALVRFFGLLDRPNLTFPIVAPE